MQQFEQAPVPEDIKDNNLRPLTITLDPVTEANGSITVVTEDERITEDMKPISIEVGTPETFKAPITVATASGTATLTCPNAVGSSTVKVTFVKTSPVEGGYDYPPAVTSTEFDILADRIGSLSTLTTTAKTSAVDAINELDSDISTLNGKLNTIETSAAQKTSVVSTSWTNTIQKMGRLIVVDLNGQFASSGASGTAQIYTNFPLPVHTVHCVGATDVDGQGEALRMALGLDGVLKLDWTNNVSGRYFSVNFCYISAE